MITLYKGSRGKGKTLTMVKDALKYHQRGFRVLSNLSLTFAEKVTSEYLLGLDRTSQLYNCVLVIDEIEVFFDSRSWKKEENKKFSNFLQQIRKRNVFILCTAQYTNLIDIRLRQQIDTLAMPFFDKNSLFCKCIYVDITSFESSRIPKSVQSLYYAKPIFQLYDTTEMIS